MTEKKKPLPEVENYFETVRKSADQYQKEVDAVRHSSNPFGSDAKAKRQRAREDHYERTQKAWEELQKSKNSLVAWMGKQEDIFINYRTHGETILRALPADIDELDNISEVHGWCSTWEDFKRKALADSAVHIEFEFEIKHNGGRWAKWYDIWLGTGTYFSKPDAEALFKRGMENISFEAEQQIYTIRSTKRTILISS